MSEKEVEAGQETGEEAAGVEQQPPAEEAEEKPVKEKEAAKAEEKPVEAKEVAKPVEKAVGEPKAAAKAEKVVRSAAVENLMATIKNMTVLELAELIKALEAEFGVSAAAPVAVAAVQLRRLRSKRSLP